jgi:predicted alpha/beta superfamily hydrolase
LHRTRIQAIRALFILMILSVIHGAELRAQSDGDPVSIGKYKTISSKVLNEERRILVHLPRNYHKSGRSFPVFYLLYGDHRTTYFARAVSILDSLGNGGRIPEMILVAVENTDRYRDLLPERPDGSPTGIARFIDFFKTELIPLVEKNYRCKTYRLIMGPQAGANFAFYTLFREPDLFDAAIITNPFRWRGGRELMFKQAIEAFKQDTDFKKTLYITTSDNDELEMEGAKQVQEFSAQIEEIRPASFKMVVNHIKNWDEFLAPLGIHSGIKTIFKNYPGPSADRVEGLEALKQHCLNLTREYGYEVDLPEHRAVQVYDALMRKKRSGKALEILTYILENNPSSLNGLWRMAGIHRKNGNLDGAIRNLEKMAEIMGSDAGMIRRLLDQLKKKRDADRTDKGQNGLAGL